MQQPSFAILNTPASFTKPNFLDPHEVQERQPIYLVYKDKSWQKTICYFLTRHGQSITSLHLIFTNLQQLPTLRPLITRCSPALSSFSNKLRGFVDSDEEQEDEDWTLDFLNDCSQLQRLKLGRGMWNLDESCANAAWGRSIRCLTLKHMDRRYRNYNFLDSITPQLHEFTLYEHWHLAHGPVFGSHVMEFNFSNARLLRFRFASNELKLKLTVPPSLKSLSMMAKWLVLSCKSTAPLALDHLLLYGQERLVISSLRIASVRAAYLNGPASDEESSCPRLSAQLPPSWQHVPYGISNFSWTNWLGSIAQNVEVLIVRHGIPIEEVGVVWRNLRSLGIVAHAKGEHNKEWEATLENDRAFMDDGEYDDDDMDDYDDDEDSIKPPFIRAPNLQFLFFPSSKVCNAPALAALRQDYPALALYCVVDRSFYWERKGKRVSNAPLKHVRRAKSGVLRHRFLEKKPKNVREKMYSVNRKLVEGYCVEEDEAHMLKYKVPASPAAIPASLMSRKITATALRSPPGASAASGAASGAVPGGAVAARSSASSAGGTPDLRSGRGGRGRAVAARASGGGGAGGGESEAAGGAGGGMVLAAVLVACIGAFAFGCHISVVNGPLDHILVSTGAPGNSLVGGVPTISLRLSLPSLCASHCHLSAPLIAISLRLSLPSLCASHCHLSAPLIAISLRLSLPSLCASHCHLSAPLIAISLRLSLPSLCASHCHLSAPLIAISLRLSLPSLCASHCHLSAPLIAISLRLSLPSLCASHCHLSAPLIAISLRLSLPSLCASHCHLSAPLIAISLRLSLPSLCASHCHLSAPLIAISLRLSLPSLCASHCHLSAPLIAISLRLSLPSLCASHCHLSAPLIAISLRLSLPSLCASHCHLSAPLIAISLRLSLPSLCASHCHLSAPLIAISLRLSLPSLCASHCHLSAPLIAISLRLSLPSLCASHCHLSAPLIAISLRLSLPSLCASHCHLSAPLIAISLRLSLPSLCASHCHLSAPLIAISLRLSLPSLCASHCHLSAPLIAISLRLSLPSLCASHCHLSAPLIAISLRLSLPSLCASHCHLSAPLIAISLRLSLPSLCASHCHLSAPLIAISLRLSLPSLCASHCQLGGWVVSASLLTAACGALSAGWLADSKFVPLPPRPFLLAPSSSPLPPRPFLLAPSSSPLPPRPFLLAPSSSPLPPRPFLLAPSSSPLPPRPFLLAPSSSPLPPRPFLLAPSSSPLPPRPFLLAPSSSPLPPRPFLLAPSSSPLPPRPFLLAPPRPSSSPFLLALPPRPFLLAPSSSPFLLALPPSLRTPGTASSAPQMLVGRALTGLTVLEWHSVIGAADSGGEGAHKCVCPSVCLFVHLFSSLFPKWHTWFALFHNPATLPFPPTTASPVSPPMPAPSPGHQSDSASIGRCERGRLGSLNRLDICVGIPTALFGGSGEKSESEGGHF
ncbi:unnamed protein product [Closterium sp. Naga37s-1]|nr:unnamed protein product [Closterium sp. Naga37s-1]